MLEIALFVICHEFDLWRNEFANSVFEVCQHEFAELSLPRKGRFYDKNILEWAFKLWICDAPFSSVHTSLS